MKLRNVMSMCLKQDLNLNIWHLCLPVLPLTNSRYLTCEGLSGVCIVFCVCWQSNSSQLLMSEEWLILKDQSVKIIKYSTICMNAFTRIQSRQRPTIGLCVPLLELDCFREESKNSDIVHKNPPDKNETMVWENITEDLNRTLVRWGQYGCIIYYFKQIMCFEAITIF